MASGAVARITLHPIRPYHSSGLFHDLELLRMWCVTTPRVIFPERRIGALEDGYEASFLLLRALADISATRTISLRVKQGVTIQLGR